MLKNIKKGDKVLTSAGMIGTVGNIKDDTLMVKIAENTVVEFTKVPLQPYSLMKSQLRKQRTVRGKK